MTPTTGTTKNVIYVVDLFPARMLFLWGQTNHILVITVYPMLGLTNCRAGMNTFHPLFCPQSMGCSSAYGHQVARALECTNQFGRLASVPC